MFLDTLYLKNFRNYDTLKINLNSNINIFYGNNAQGKTNLLESIYVLAMTRSHRLNIDNNLIKDNEKVCKIKGTIKNNNLKTNMEIILQDKNKTLKIDNDEIKKVGDYIAALFSIIIFYPEDLDIIKGAPSDRRNFINLELSQISNNYYKILNDYNKIIKIRNDLLKKISQGLKVDEAYFKIITDSLIEKAIIIYRMRSKFINELNQECGKIFFDLTKNEGFYLKYQTNIEFESFEADYLRECLKENFKKQYKKEKKLATTLIGPHRDDIEFYLNDKNVKEYGSQGQQRVAVLSLKLAEIPIFQKYKNVNPVLLLDDVFSELDDIKKNNLIKYLKNDIQVIITTTDLKHVNKKILGNANVFKIKDGQVIKLEELSENDKQ